MNKQQQKLTRFSLIGLGIFLIVFWTSIFNGCYYGLMNQALIPSKAFEISFATLIPILLGTISLIISGFFKSFTKEDAIRQIEKQLRNGVISQQQYQDSIKGIEMFEMERRKQKAILEIEKENFVKEVMEMKEDIKQKVIDKKEDKNEKTI